MRKNIVGFSAVLIVGMAVAVGYGAGAGVWTDPRRWISAPEARIVDTSAALGRERKVLYWKHPDGAAEYAAALVKSTDGRDFVPVYDDQERNFLEATRNQPPTSVAESERKILYYRNPMGLPDTSPVPKKDWMGMDYIAVYKGDEEGGSTVKVNLDKVQRSGVRTAPVERRRLIRPVRAPGDAKPDERTLYSVVLRADSFIEKLYVNETGRHVKKGEPLFRIYSPEMVRVQVDYRISGNSLGRRDEKGALQRLQNLQIPRPVVESLQRSGEPVMLIDWPSPVSGVVMLKKAVDGMMMKAGDEAMRIADLSNIWIIADVAEQDIGHVSEGKRAKVTFRAFPNEVFEGRVTFILHELDMTTRTAKVRIEIANPKHRIRHEMFAEVEIDADADAPERLVVPLSALIDSGNRQVVIVDRGEGRFDPRPVKVGLRGDDFIEITEGVAAGEQVVVAANFLIDAESNLKAALAGFTAGSPLAGEVQTAPAADKKP